MNEERAHACGIPRWIKFGIGLRACRVAAKKGLALAPASAANDLPVAFDYVVGLIVDELSIDAEYRIQGRAPRPFALSSNAPPATPAPTEGSAAPIRAHRARLQDDVPISCRP
jgi:hypothetical protein